MSLASLRTAVARRVRGRTWWYRAPLLLLYLWVLVGVLDDPTSWSIFGGITLGVHEAGHAAFSWIGHRMLTVAGGTIFQLAIPLVVVWYLFVKQRDPFGATLGLLWLGTSLVDAGVYAADARAGALPLVSPFGPVDPGSHDWGTMLMKYGLLNRDQEIGAAFRAAGILTIVLSIVAALCVLWVMRKENSAEPGEASGAGAANE